MSKEIWTEERIRAAYAEWYALENYALDVAAAMASAKGERVCYYALKAYHDPREFCVLETDDPDRSAFIPLQWLWTYPACLEEAKAQHEAWKQSRAGQEQEARDRAEFERLKAKFASEVAR